MRADPCKYFGNELGAQTQMDAKTDRYIVNGAHEASKLQELLDGFIRKFVLCPACTNPETDLVRYFSFLLEFALLVVSCSTYSRATCYTYVFCD